MSEIPGVSIEEVPTPPSPPPSSTGRPSVLEPNVARATPLTRAISRSVEVRRASELPYVRFLKEFVEPRIPVVVQGGTDAWPAMKKWTPEYFKTRFGPTPVEVGYDTKMPFDRFIDEVLASTDENPGPYMYRLFLHEHLPELLPDVTPQNPYAFPRRYASPLMLPYWRRPDGYLKLLIGGVGGRFPIMHYDGDNAHATITEIYGDKEIVLYPPGDSAYLYPKAERANHFGVDDPVNQELDRFPLLAKATQHRAVLSPGDAVFVPCGWWHTARALTVSISVCTNMVDGSNWAGYVSEVTALKPGLSTAKQLIKRAYLTGLGPAMSLLEALQQGFPSATRALRVPGLLSPATAAHAREPSTLKIRGRRTTY